MKGWRLIEQKNFAWVTFDGKSELPKIGGKYLVAKRMIQCGYKVLRIENAALQADCYSVMGELITTIIDFSKTEAVIGDDGKTTTILPIWRECHRDIGKAEWSKWRICRIPKSISAIYRNGR